MPITASQCTFAAQTGRSRRPGGTATPRPAGPGGHRERLRVRGTDPIIRPDIDHHTRPIPQPGRSSPAHVDAAAPTRTTTTRTAATTPRQPMDQSPTPSDGRSRHDSNPTCAPVDMPATRHQRNSVDPGTPAHAGPEPPPRTAPPTTATTDHGVRRHQRRKRRTHPRPGHSRRPASSDRSPRRSQLQPDGTNVTRSCLRSNETGHRVRSACVP